MPWYKLPHADLVMWFEQGMDLEPADDPAHVMDVTTFDDDEPRFIPKPAPFATGGVFKGPMPKIGYPEGVLDEVVIPNAPKPRHWPKLKPEEETEAT